MSSRRMPLKQTLSRIHTNNKDEPLASSSSDWEDNEDEDEDEDEDVTDHDADDAEEMAGPQRPLVKKSGEEEEELEEEIERLSTIGPRPVKRTAEPEPEPESSTTIHEE